jgi:hypothetical protein
MTTHLVINTLTGQINCDHCGAIEEYNSKMPLPLEAATALIKAYAKIHKRCKPSPEGDALKKRREEAWKKYIEDNPYECPDCGSRFKSEEVHKFCQWRKKDDPPTQQV